MRPPICVICENDFRHDTEGGLLSFQLTEKEKENNKRFEESGFVGHPDGLEWFCEKHHKMAKKYQHLTLAQAIQKIKEEEKNTE